MKPHWPSSYNNSVWTGMLSTSSWRTTFWKIPSNASLLSDILFFHVSALTRDSDIDLLSKITCCKHLSVTQMLPQEYGVNLLNSIQEFNLISVMRNPSDKLQKIINTVHLLGNDSSLILTSDHLLSLLILVVVNSNVYNILSNINFIKSFTFEKNLNVGQHGFALSSLEAVLEYIGNKQSELSALSSSMHSFLQCIELMDTVQLAVLVQKYANQDILNSITIKGDNLMTIACTRGNTAICQICSLIVT